jgi:hypothetical protein
VAGLNHGEDHFKFSKKEKQVACMQSRAWGVFRFAFVFIFVSPFSVCVSGVSVISTDPPGHAGFYASFTARVPRQ